jgi:HAD superfamily hydrolase (TIGR01509 family)
LRFKPRAILWDLDGTIVDSNACHLYTWESVLKTHGYRIDRGIYTENFGRKSSALLTALLGFEPEQDLMLELIGEKERLYQKIAADWITLIPGVLTWLEEAQVLNISQAIASSAPIGNITTVLEIMNLGRFFEVIVPGTDLPAKPHPDIFLHAARSLDVPPQDCLVIEDAISGVEGAYQAGMPCIAVSTTHTPEELQQADLIIKDFNVPFVETLKKLNLN